MMLRPATPLSIIFLLAFILLLLSTLSTPIIKAIPLASYQDINFGVFGWCNKDGKCSGINIGYSTGMGCAPLFRRMGLGGGIWHRLPADSIHF
jgi:hypothetical protein